MLTFYFLLLLNVHKVLIFYLKNILGSDVNVLKDRNKQVLQWTLRERGDTDKHELWGKELKEHKVVKNIWPNKYISITLICYIHKNINLSINYYYQTYHDASMYETSAQSGGPQMWILLSGRHFDCLLYTSRCV